MQLTNSHNNLLADLTEEETASLNGGRFCRYVYFYRRVRVWYGWIIRRFIVWRCFW